MPDSEALEARWEAAGFDPLTAQAASTLEAPGRTRAVMDETWTVTDAGELAGVATSPEQLELGEVLGRGGMGVVRLARQRSLRREVAVKTVHGAASACAALLKEAWVGGALEHPHIVPVHTLGRVGDGLAMVMKRVEGRSLQAEIEHDVDDLEAARVARVRILVAVCRAIGFAHERGILHLDLKPENVMLGEFGEVYVVDWGLAAGYGSSRPAWLPAAETIEGIAGTPAFMAPELAAGDAAKIGPATDVYLLGGTLSAMLTGTPLHDGANVMQVLLAAWESAPKPLPGVDPSLAAIVHRATAREPAERYPSADALREALEGYLRHRLAERLARRAVSIADELAPTIDEVHGDAEVEPRLAELAQAIAQARAAWAAHPDLRGLDERLLDLRAAHALAHERPAAAQAFLERLRAPSPTRLARLDAVRESVAERAAHRDRLEAMGRELDLSLGSVTRRRLFAVFGACWLGFSLMLGWLTRSGVYPIGYRELLLEGGLLVGALLPIGWAIRGAVFQNRANRRLYGGLIATALTVEVHWLACGRLQIEVMTAVSCTALIYAFAFGALAVLDRRFGWGALAMGLTAVACALAPTWAYDLIGLGGFASVAAILASWRGAR